MTSLDRKNVFSYPRHSFLLVFALFIAGLVLRLYFNVTTDAVTYGTDSAARFMQAKEWYQNPEGIPGGLVWLPLYHVMILTLTPFGLSIASSGRIIILLLSVLSIPLFYLVIRKIFTKEIAFWSALLLAINPFHVLYSSLYMSENMFLFFVLASFYFLLRFLDSGKHRYLIISSLLINGASMLRYEGWLIAGLLPWFLFFKRKDLVLSAQYFIYNCICILIYCKLSFASHGVPAWGIHVATMDVQADLASRPDKIAHIISRLSSELIFPVWFYFLLLAGVVYAIVKRFRPAYLFVWLTLLSFSAYKVLTFTSQPFWRYFSCSLLMLIPFGVWWIAAISKNSKRYFSVTLLLIIMLSLPALAESYYHRKQMSNAPAAYKEACRLLKDVRHPNEKVIFNIRISGFDHASFQEDADIHSSLTFYPMNSWLKMFGNYEVFSDKELIQLMHDTSYHYIFVQKNLLLDSVLYSESVRKELAPSNIELDTLYNSSDFQLLDIKRGSN